MRLSRLPALFASLAALPALAGLACAGARPGPAAPSAASPASAGRLWLSGASNIRRFTCATEDIEVRVLAPAGATPAAMLAGTARAELAAIELPVSTLDCGIGAQSKHLHESLGAPEHSTIAFRVERYTVVPGEASDADEQPVRLDGTLRIAGRERPASIAAAATAEAGGRLRLRGSHALDVRDFGVRPPRRFLGLLRVRERVTIGFDVVVAR